MRCALLSRQLCHAASTRVSVVSGMKISIKAFQTSIPSKKMTTVCIKNFPPRVFCNVIFCFAKRGFPATAEDFPQTWFGRVARFSNTGPSFQIWTVEGRQCLSSPQTYNGTLFSSVLLDLLDGETLSITLGNEYVVGRRVYYDMF